MDIFFKKQFEQKRLPNALIFENKSDIKNPIFFLKNDEGVELGRVHLKLKEEPFKHYYVTNVIINKEFRNKKYGSLIIEKMNTFLIQDKKVGALQNIADTEDEQRKLWGMENDLDIWDIYERHNWKYLSEYSTNYMAFNSSEDEYKILRKKYLGI